MNISTGIKAFGTSVGKLQGNSATQTRTASATDMQQNLGDMPVGDYLNQISDPNWIDPAKQTRTVGNNDLDRDAFFKLMLEQMKRQDPTNPLKSHEMAAQLAQFSSIEQLNNINDSIAQLHKQQEPVAQFQALQFIGKSVSGDSALVSRFEGDTNHEFEFDLPAQAGEVKIQVKNESGETVREYKLKNQEQGKNQIMWNGLGENGLPVPPGQYRFVTEARTNQGKKLNVRTDFSGQISGVNFTKEGAVLLIGNKSVKLSDVKKIIDPNVGNNGQKIRNVNAQALRNVNAAGDNKETKVAAAPAAPPKGNLDSVKMTGEMLSKLDKEMKSGQ